MKPVRTFVEVLGNIGPHRMADLVRRGIVSDFYVRVGPGYEANEGAAWREAARMVREAGGRVWVWAWCTEDQAGSAEDIRACDARLEPDGIYLNIEKPLEGIPLGPLVGPVAALEKPMVAGIAASNPNAAWFDYRTLEKAGVAIEFECYVDSGEGPHPSVAVRELARTTRVLPGWRYRANVDGVLGWGELDDAPYPYVFYPKKATLHLDLKNDPGWPPFVVEDRTLYDWKDWHVRGALLGLAPYANIRVALDTTRTAQANRDLEEWAQLAASARLPGASKRGVSVYLAEVTPDEVFIAIAEGAS